MLKPSAVVLIVAWIAASPAAAQDVGRNRPMAEMQGTCADYTINLHREFVAMTGRVVAATAATTAAAAPSIALDRAVDLRLVRQGEVVFAKAPETPHGTPDSFAGLVSLGVLPNGLWRVSANRGLWFDLVSGGRLLASPTFEMQAKCPEVYKSVVFEQAESGVVLLQVSGGTEPSVRFVVTPAEPDGLTFRERVVVVGRNLGVDTARTVTKSSAPIIETPQAIAVVDSAFIDTLNLRTTAEALNYTSGVRAQAFGSDTRIDYYQLRGFASQNFFKDGLVLYNSGAFLSWSTPPEGIDRLEVLKGPASVLYGSSSAGGLVNIVSKAPDRQSIVNVEVGADEYGSVYTSIDVGRPIADSVALRASGLVRGGDTQVELAEDNRTFGALALGWTPAAATSLTLRASYTRDRSNRPTGFLPYAGFVTPLADGSKIPIDLFVSDPSIDRYDRDQSELGYGLETTLGKRLRLVSNGRVARIDLLYAGLFGQFTGNPVLSGGRYLINRSNSEQDAYLDNVSTDNHVSGSVATGPFVHTVLAGLDYSDSETRSSQRTGTAPPLDIFAPVYNVAIPALGAPATTRQKLGQTGIYVQDQIKAGGVVALLSARHDWVSITSTNAAGVVTTGSPANTSHRTGLVYLTAFGIAPYANYATSFTPVIGIEPATGNYYRPETGTQWEAGLRYDATALPLLASASLFTIDRDGVLVSNPVAGFPTNQSQLGLQRSRGGEVQVQARPVPTLTLNAALTAFNIDVRQGNANTIGKTPTATPEMAASLFADYTLPQGWSLAGFGAGAGVRHVGTSYADALNTLVVPAATAFDAALHYQAGRFRAALNVSNLFDKAYVGACPAAGTCYAANLRRATLSVGYRP